MATTIKLKTGSGAPLNTDLVQGEPAIDLTNKRLYTEDGTDTVIEIGTNPTEVTTGDLTATGTVTLSSIAYPTSDGTNGQLLATDGAGTLSFINSSSSTNVLNRTATGAISAGDPLMLNSNGTVSKITGVNPETGSNFVISTADIEGIAYDTAANKAVVIYTDSANSDNLYAVVCTFSGSSVSFGTPVSVRAVDSDSGVSRIVFDGSTNKVVIATISNLANNTSAKFYVGTVSGSSISFGTEVSYALPAAVGNVGNNFYDLDLAYDSTAGGIIFVYGYLDIDFDGSFTLSTTMVSKVDIGTVSGSSITFNGAATVSSTTRSDFSFSSGYVFTRCVYNAGANKTVLFVQDNGSPSAVNGAFLATVSGGSVTAGSENAYTLGAIAYGGAPLYSYDSDNQDIIFLDNLGKINFAAISGSSVTFGAGETPSGYNSSYPTALAYDENLNKTIFFARTGSGLSFYQVTLSGTTIAVSDPHIVSIDYLSTPALVYDPDNLNCYAVYSGDGGGIDENERVVPASYPTTNYVTDTFIGFAGDAAADGELVPVQLYGVNGDQTGITINQQYYLAYDGTLTTETIKRVQSRNIARGLSATEVLIATPSNI